MAKLFTPIKLREITFKNRIFMSPMCQYSAKGGIPGPWHMVNYGSRAVGGVSLVIVEATAVSPEGRITPWDTGLWSNAHVEAFRPIVDFIREQGAVPGIQIGHAGRKASCDAPWRGGHHLPTGSGGWTTVAPSAVSFSPAHAAPKALSIAEIDRLVTQFVETAQRALAAGFEVIELHCAHGYLLNEFLSPLANRREDEYGGSFDNRCRLPLRIAAEIRKLWPAQWPMFVRISATDWVEGGWDIEQSVRFAQKLREIGVDLVDCSTGGMVPDAVIPAGPASRFRLPKRFGVKGASPAVPSA
jgi:2,4-dienoyl-CoA reductase-like NADH-dependent reductase (Old Yellow Enzyme family)